MRQLIENLDEHISCPIKPIGGGIVRGGPDPVACGPAGSDEGAIADASEDDVAEDDDTIELEEGSVGIAAIQKLITAIVTSPKLTTKLKSIVRQAGDEGAMDSVLTALGAHLRIAIPLSLKDSGINIQKAQASKAKRAARAVVQGKSAVEAIEMSDEEFLAALGEELENSEA